MNPHHLRTVLLNALLLTCMTATAHHSNSQYDIFKVEVMTGTVTNWAWSNPHTWLRLSIDDGKGGKTEWALEGRAPGVLTRAGWAPKCLTPGERVTVHYSPSKNGAKVGMIASVTLPDGTVLGNVPPRIE